MPDINRERVGWKTDDRRLFEETRNNLDVIENLVSEMTVFLESLRKEGNSSPR